MEKLLEIRRLQTYFFLRRATVKAVDGVSFWMAPGEMVGLVGESGSGKSVTALSILRLIQPPGRIVAGEIIFQDRNVLALSESEMNATVRGQAISMVFQNPRSCLNPVMKVGDQIARVHRTHRGSSAQDARVRALDFLRLVQISDPERVMERYPHQLSGGMCQRAMLAMALVNEPSLVIADEPTTGLDVTVQGQILELLRGLREKTAAAQLLITHDLGVVAETCDRMVVMYGGRVVETGPVADVFSAPLHPYTAALLQSVPDVKKDFRATTIPGSVPDPRSFPAGCRFHPRCADFREECSTEAPELVQVTADRAVACHRPSRPNRPAGGDDRGASVEAAP